jgi:hypothetical protein
MAAARKGTETGLQSGKLRHMKKRNFQNKPILISEHPCTHMLHL